VVFVFVFVVVVVVVVVVIDATLTAQAVHAAASIVVPTDLFPHSFCWSLFVVSDNELSRAIMHRVSMPLDTKPWNVATVSP